MGESTSGAHHSQAVDFAMRKAFASKVVHSVWLLIGFALGCAFMVLYRALNIWPMQDDYYAAWVRWAGKETIKWAYVAVIFAMIAFVAMQVINGLSSAWQLRKERHRGS